MITTAVAAPIWAHWIMAGLFGLLGTFLLEYFFWNRRVDATTVQKDVEADAADANRYMTAYEAIHYIVDKSKWGAQVRQHRSEQYVPIAGRVITMGTNALIDASSGGRTC